MRGHIISGPEGQSLAAPISQTGSAHLSSLAGGENAPARETGELVNWWNAFPSTTAPHKWCPPATATTKTITLKPGAKTAHELSQIH